MPKSILCEVKPGRPERTRIDISFYPTYKLHNWHIANGYVYTTIKGKRVFLAHMVKNFDPAKDRSITLDHTNQDKLDNRWKNLREVDKTTQTINRTLSNKSTPIQGISLTENTYMVNYTLDHIQYHRYFSFGTKSKDYMYEAWVKSKEFNLYVRTTIPAYRFASNLDNNDSSSGSIIGEDNYEHRIVNERVRRDSLNKHKYITKFATYFQVRYFDFYGSEETTKCFSFGVKSSDTEAEALLKAIAFRDLYAKYRPSDKRGSKKTINKIDSRDVNESIQNITPTKKKKIKTKITRINNNHKHEHNHIWKDGNRWRLRYYDEQIIERTISFPFGPSSTDSEAEALVKAISFRDEHEMYRPHHKKRESKKKAIPKISWDDNESIISCESNANQSGENSNDCSSNSDTISMNEDELKEEMKKIKTTTPIESMVLGVNLDLLKNKYEVAFTEGGYLKLIDFNFGQDEEYKNWVEARFFAEKLREEKNNLLLLNK